MINLADYDALTHQIIGCAMRVQRTMSSGFPEVIYQRALQIELQKQGIASEREVELSVYYQGEKVGARRADFLVDSRVLVELKAVAALTSAHQAQLLGYLEAFRIQVGLLLNFGAIRLEYKRLLKNKPIP
ncbi:GxxExxY protein [Hymenobacter sp. BT18]|uniref:GxxExxY protein n=1 Tax=Hymenobacter sp. BT18 TaxID=2835648 RepID=UPI00143E4499|nr:GxxExxY protein [Hymenobacter sp. BT18]QIX61411.1 GxxExxY protein [Hymenobacter sp. BT18]